MIIKLEITDSHSISGETWKKFTEFANKKFDIKKNLSEGKTLDFEGSFKIQLDKPDNNNWNSVPEIKIIKQDLSTGDSTISYFPFRNLEGLLINSKEYEWTNEIGITFTNYSYKDLIELLKIVKYNENTPIAVYKRGFLPTKEHWEDLNEFSKELLTKTYFLEELLLKHNQIFNYIILNYKLNSLNKILNIFYVIDSAETVILAFEKYINENFLQIDGVLKTHLLSVLEKKRTAYATSLIQWENLALKYDAELMINPSIKELYNKDFWIKNINKIISISQELNETTEANFLITEYYEKIQEIFLLLKKQYILIYQNKKYLDRKGVLASTLKAWEDINELYKKNIEIYKRFASVFVDVPNNEFYTFEFYEHKI